MNEWLNNPLVKRMAEMKEHFAPIVNNPAYNLTQYLNGMSFNHVVEIQKHTLPHLRNQRYFEKIAELIQWAVELDEELEAKSDEVKSVITQYHLVIKERYGIDVINFMREFVTLVYINTEVEELRYIPRSEIVKDLVLFAKEKRDEFDTIANVIDSLVESVGLNNKSALTFNELIPDQSKRLFIEQAMVDLQITDVNGKCILKERRRSVLLAFVHILKYYKVVPDLSNAALLTPICKKIGLVKTPKLETDSDTYEDAYKSIDSYFKANCPGIPKI